MALWSGWSRTSELPPSSLVGPLMVCWPVRAHHGSGFRTWFGFESIWVGSCSMGAWGNEQQKRKLIFWSSDRFTPIGVMEQSLGLQPQEESVKNPSALKGRGSGFLRPFRADSFLHLQTWG